MSFPTYPAYKDSGVEWLGEVPEHWYPARFSRVVMAIKDGTHGTFERVDQGVPLLSAKNVQNGFLDISECESLISEEDSRSIVSNGFPSAGDLLLTIVGTIGRSCVYKADKPYAFQRSVCFLRFYKRHCPYFFYYFSQSKFFQEQLAGRSKSSAQAGVYMGDVVATSVVFPPTSSEQTQIARFLDHETARIDALIEEQQRLIELLKEKRQAVISRAVTKGLDPTVPMKDSGVEWLGEVPAHWSFKQSKYLFEFVTSGSRGWAEYYSDDGDLFFRITNLTRDSIEPKLVLLQYVTPPKNAEGERSRVRSGDILISITADLGSVCVANDEVEGSYVSQHVALARPIRSAVFSRWLAYFVLSATCKDQLVGAGYGGTKVQLSLDDIRSFWVSMPPYNEQMSLADFLDKEIQSFDRLITEAATGVELLSERRAALISAAVTGKIDVRGWQPQVNAGYFGESKGAQQV